MHRPWRVLLVDDDTSAREACGEVLTAFGYEVLDAENGARAIEVALARKPDVIVMDLEMPVMDGLEAIRRLRADGRTREMPVVVLSGKQAMDRAELTRVGADLALAKPCDPNVLEGTLRSLVEGNAAEPMLPG